MDETTLGEVCFNHMCLNSLEYNPPTPHYLVRVLTSGQLLSTQSIIRVARDLPPSGRRFRVSIPLLSLFIQVLRFLSSKCVISLVHTLGECAFRNCCCSLLISFWSLGKVLYAPFSLPSTTILWSNLCLASIIGFVHFS